MGVAAETPAAPCCLPIPQGCSLPAPATATLPPSSLSCSHQWQEGPPALSPHLRRSSCREVGGREKQAAGTLKFLISISTSGRENLQRRRGLLQWAGRDTGTLSPAESPVQLNSHPGTSFPLTEGITQNPAPKRGLPGCKAARGALAPTWGHLPAPWWGPYCSASPWLRLSGCSAAQCSLPWLPTWGQSPQGRDRGEAAAPRSSLTSSLGHSPPSPIGVPPCCPSPTATRLLTRSAGGGSYHPRRHACASPKLVEQDTCAGVALPTHSLGQPGDGFVLPGMPVVPFKVHDASLCPLGSSGRVGGDAARPWEACQPLHGSVGCVKSLQGLSCQQPGTQRC